MPVLSISEKVANANQPLLVFHSGLVKNANVKTLTDADMEKGYVIEDFRKESMTNEAVWKDAEQEFSTVNIPGVYAVLLADGSTHDMMVGYKEHMDLCRCKDSFTDYGIQLPGDESGRGPDLVLIDTNNNYSKDVRTNKGLSQGDLPMGKFSKDLDDTIGVEKPESGKAYRIYHVKKKSFSEPFWVKSVKANGGGLTEVVCSSSNYDSQDAVPILLNPDYEDCDKADRVFGKSCRFVAIESEDVHGYRRFKSDIPIGDTTALNMMIFDEGYKKATVKKLKDRYLIHSNELGRHYTPELNKVAAKLFVMTKFAMREPQADAILASADQEPNRSPFFYLPLTKSATNIRFNQWPDFLDTINSDFNVPEQPHTHQILQTERDEQYVEPQRVGDRFSMETGDTIDGKTPMDLYQLSKTRGNSSLFEHGVVGSLTNTYDSMAMIDKWMPKLEEALDCIGRTLFLFYWKPEDFAQAYGTDDQEHLEDQLVSQFKSLGSLVIQMIQKKQI